MKKPKKEKPEGQVGQPLRTRKAPLRTEEYYREITAVIRGRDQLSRIEPRDAMLDALYYFHALSEEHKAEQAFWTEQLMACKTPEEVKRCLEGLELAKLQTKENLLLVVDTSFKVAPYCHAKLSSVEVTGANKGPIEIMGLMLKEIEEANRDRPIWAPPTLELESE
jgi:hypothetical protein